MYDIGARIAPQFHSYTVSAPSNLKVNEFAVPMFAWVPLTPSLTIDIGTSYARSHVEQTTFGNKTTSDIAGLTDTQIRANYVLGHDFIVLTAGINLPTGQSRVKADQVVAAGLIGSDFLGFPISNMGTGFGTGGIALARPLGEWSLGIGVSVRRSSQYEPFDVGGGPALHYQPGNEYRARVGVDRPVGTGRATLGVTYSAFGNDQLAGSVYNTGDRYITQFGLNNSFGGGELSPARRTCSHSRNARGRNGTRSREHRQRGAVVRCARRLGDDRAERRGRTWTRRARRRVCWDIRCSSPDCGGGMAVMPSVRLSVGRLAAQDNAVVRRRR